MNIPKHHVYGFDNSSDGSHDMVTYTEPISDPDSNVRYMFISY